MAAEPHFEFPSFVDRLAGLPVQRMIEQAKTEICSVAAMAPRAPGAEFERGVYMRCLARLLGLLSGHQLPPDLTSGERAAYRRLGLWLLPNRSTPPEVIAAFRELYSEEKSFGRGKTRTDMLRLRAFDIFAELDDEELAEIARSCEERKIPPGTVLFHQGQVGNEIHLMEEGTVSIYREKNGECQPLVMLEGPAVFGEMAIVNPERIRTASVMSVSEVRVLAIHVSLFLAFLRRFPALRLALRRLVVQRSSGASPKPAAHSLPGHKAAARA